MGAFINMTGWIMSEHGVEDSNIKVIRLASEEEKRNNNITSLEKYWWCQCLKHPDNPLTLIYGQNLKKGKTKNCACCRHTSNKIGGFIDLTDWVLEEHGYNNNKIKVIKRAQNPGTGHQTYWECICLKHSDNGTFIAGKDSILKNDCYICPTCLKEHKIIDMTDWIMSEHGFPNSNIKVIRAATAEEQEKYSSKSQYWWCQCLDHPNNPLELILGTSLRKGDTQHCSCCKAISNGEITISKLLENNNIKFEKEKGFEDFRYTESNRMIRFDFWVNNNYIIEFDGKQHFKATGYGWNNKDNLELVKKRDELRNQYCKEHNIPLIRIPYTHLKNLCLEDLLLETTTFRYC